MLDFDPAVLGLEVDGVDYIEHALWSPAAMNRNAIASAHFGLDIAEPGIKGDFKLVEFIDRLLEGGEHIRIGDIKRVGV